MSLSNIDVLCVGMATYDITFAVDAHPEADTKCFASERMLCGGGPAANAAVTVARLGGSSAFMGQLGRDVFGDLHREELLKESIAVDGLIQQSHTTPLSFIIVKPNGNRAVINHKGNLSPISEADLDFALSEIQPRVLLFDGHEANISYQLGLQAKKSHIPTIMDAGSVYEGTLKLLPISDYIVASLVFAKEFSALDEPYAALKYMSKLYENVIITLGEYGVIWKTHQGEGSLNAYQVDVVDTTGAGDTFHGAFALGVAQNKLLRDNLKYADAAAALCCTKMGARTAIPFKSDVDKLLGI